MALTGIKEGFKNWLLKNGFREKTASGRPSSTYQYIKRIDKFCLNIYGSCDESVWDGQLKKDIEALLLYLYEISNKGYYINQLNISDLHTYFNKITKQIYFIESIEKSHSIELYLAHKGKTHLAANPSFWQVFDYIDAIKFIYDNGKESAESTMDQIEALFAIQNPSAYNQMKDFFKCVEEITSDSDLHAGNMGFIINYKEKQNTHEKNALEKFYNYLKETDSARGISIPTSISKQQPNPFEEILSQTKSQKAIFKISFAKELSGANPPEVKLHTGTPYFKQYEIAAALNCDRGLAGRLASEFNIHKEEDLNAFLKEHQHKRKKTLPKINYKLIGKNYWCNLKEAAKILGCSDKTVIARAKKGDLTYIRYSKRYARYFKPELEALAKRFSFNKKSTINRKKKK